MQAKFTTPYTFHDTGKYPHVANTCGNHRKSIHISVRDSLKKLQTDYIGEYFLTLVAQL